MALDFKKIQDVDSTLIRGFLRMQLESDEYQLAPDLIIYSILAFYYNPEYFAFSPANISDDGTTVTATGINQNVYGNMHIPSDSNDCHVWTFLMHASKQGEGDDSAFGVVDAQCFTEKGLCMQNWYGHCVGLDQEACISTAAEDYDVHDAPICFVVGDVIKMKLDLKQRDLSFAVKDGEWKSVAQDIKVSEDFHYKMMVFLGFVDDCIKLLDYARFND